MGYNKALDQVIQSHDILLQGVIEVTWPVQFQLNSYSLSWNRILTTNKPFSPGPLSKKAADMSSYRWVVHWPGIMSMISTTRNKRLRVYVTVTLNNCGGVTWWWPSQVKRGLLVSRGWYGSDWGLIHAWSVSASGSHREAATPLFRLSPWRVEQEPGQNWVACRNDKTPPETPAASRRAERGMWKWAVRCNLG